MRTCRGRFHALVASMEGHWKPTGRLLPEGSVVEVELPPGAYRLTPGPNIRLHAGGGEGDPSGNAESDAQVVSEGDKVYAFVHHKSRVGAFVEGVGPGDRFILLEELDAAEWQPQGPPAPATPAR